MTDRGSGDQAGLLRVVTEQFGDGQVMVARVQGEMDMSTVEDLHTALADAVADQPRHLVVDLGEVSFVSSRCLGVLVDLIADETVTGVVHLTGVIGNHPVETAINAVELSEHLKVRTEPAAELATVLLTD